MKYRRQDIINRKDEILKWIKSHESKAFICENLNCKPSTLDNYLKIFNIEYFGNRGAKGKKTDPKRKSAEEYINSESVIKSHTLKLKLIEDGLKEYRCEKCKNTEWLGLPIPLELHHVDGNRFNNKLINLKLFCPNCHAQEPNNSGAAKKKNAPMLEMVDNSDLDSDAVKSV